MFLLSLSSFTFFISSSDSENFIKERLLSLIGSVSFRVIPVIMPRMPSVPVNSFSSVPFSFFVSPFPSMTSISSVQSEVFPYFMALFPAASVATIPPMEHTLWLEGFTGKKRPYSFRIALRSSRMAPGPTVTVFFSLSGFPIKSIFDMSAIMESWGTQPPAIPLPPPLATMSHFLFSAFLSNFIICSFLAGHTTALVLPSIRDESKE